MIKKKNKRIKPRYDELLPILIALFRKLHPIKGGERDKPLDSLLNREFQHAVQSLISLSSKDIYYDLKHPDSTGAYLLYYWIRHYAKGLSLLSELPKPPERVLDLSVGAGSFALAAYEHGAHEVCLGNPNQAQLDLAAQICGSSGYPLTPRRFNGNLYQFPFKGSFDLIILGYELFRLFPNDSENATAKQKQFILRLFRHLSKDGFLLLVEDSKSTANRAFLRLRNELVQSQIPIQAPCVCQTACPALQTNHQCYAQRPFQPPQFVYDLERKAKLKSGSIKMSYLILKHPDACKSAPDQEVYRVISRAIETHTSKHLYLCGTKDIKTIHNRTTASSKTTRIFDDLKRGDLITVTDSIESDKQLYLNEESQVNVITACAKPVTF